MTARVEVAKARDLNADIKWNAADGSDFAGIARFLTDDYAMEPKWDGVRCLILFGDDHNRVLAGRSGHDLANNFPHLRDAVIPGMAGMILDGELIANGVGTDAFLADTTTLVNSNPRHAIEIQRYDGPARFYAFDILADHEDDLTGRPYGRGDGNRRDMLETVVEFWTTMYPTLPVQITPQWASTAETIRWAMRQGREGVVIKRLDGPYVAGEKNRDRSGWYKVKTVSTADAFVTGWRPGKNGNRDLVGSLEVAVLDAGRVRVIGHVGNMTLKFRRDITAPDGTLRPEFMGRVLSFAAQGIGPNGKARHPRLIPNARHWRDDKSREDCTAAQLEVFPRV